MRKTTQEQPDAFLTALKILALKPRTKAELTKKLQLKGFSDLDLQPVLLKLENEKMIDDENYVSEWLETVAARKGYGYLLIQKKLRQKGLPENLINKVYEGEYREKEREIALREGRKKLKNLRQTSARDGKIKMARFLASRGFGESLIYRVLEDLGLGF